MARKKKAAEPIDRVVKLLDKTTRVKTMSMRLDVLDFAQRQQAKRLLRLEDAHAEEARKELDGRPVRSGQRFPRLSSDRGCSMISLLDLVRWIQREHRALDPDSLGRVPGNANSTA